MTSSNHFVEHQGVDRGQNNAETGRSFLKNEEGFDDPNQG